MTIPTVWDPNEFQPLSTHTQVEESRYLKAYLPLVRKIVRQLAPQCSCIMDRQDMEQTGLMGLLAAIRRYGTPDEGFGSFAAQRIRGAILDELRSLDWRPRVLRQKYFQIKDLLRKLHNQNGHDLQWSEMAAAGISREDYQDYLQLENAGALASLDELIADAPGTLNVTGRDLEEQFINQKTLSEALALLSEKECLVLSLYYQQDMNFKEIALTLGVTEARICQINKKISEKIYQHFYPN